MTRLKHYKLVPLGGMVLGILMLTGSLNWFGQWLIETFPGLARLEELVAPDKLPTEIMKRGI